MVPGDSDEMVGAEDDTVKVTVLEVLPPSVAVTLNVPAVVSDEAGITAVSCVGLTYVVVSALPLKLTTELEVKFAPLTVSVVLGDPMVTLETERAVMLGVPNELDPFPQPETKAKKVRMRPTTAARR
jgi:hypothetical protein